MQSLKTNPSQKEIAPLKPFIIALVLILIVIGVYVIKKNYQNKKNLANIEKSKNQSEKEKTQKTINVKTVSPKETNKAINNKKYQLIDIRPSILFEYIHIESSINIPLTTNDPSTLINKDQKVIIIDEQETNEGKAFVEKLSKAGYQSFYLEGGIKNYSQNGYGLISIGDINSDQDKSKVNFISAKDTQERLKNGERFIFLDVREKSDFQQYHIEESVNIPLKQLEENKKSIPTGKLIIVDKNYIRSFQAAVRLYDMHILGIYCLSDSLNELEKQNPSEKGEEEK